MADSESWPKPVSWHGLSAEQKAWGREQSRLAALYADPIIIRANEDESTISTATGFLFKPGAKTLLITNAHVLDDAYFAFLKEYGRATFQFGDLVFEPKLIAKDSDPFVDLAVIDVDGLTFPKRSPGYWGSNMGALAPYSSKSWPTAPPVTGEAVVVAGWPAKFQARDRGSIEFAYFGMFGQRVGDIDERRFMIPFEREHWISSDFDPTNDVVNERELGGMSGGPVFTMHRAGIQTLQLIGFVQRYGESFDVLRCARADLIGVDGSISTVA